MKGRSRRAAWLPKACWARSVGAYLAEGRLTVSLVAMTPAGSKVLAGSALSVNEGGPGKVLRQWLESNLTPRQRRQTTVQVGLGAEQTFFITRCLDAEQQEVTAQTLLSSLESAGIDPAAVVADGLLLKLGSTMAYGVAACQRPLAEDIFGGLQEALVTRASLVPGPSALLRQQGRHRAPRRWKVHIRLLLDESPIASGLPAGAGGLAILVAEGRGLLWRRFATGSGQYGGMVTAIRHLQIHALHHLGVKEIAGVTVSGPITAEAVETLRLDTGLAVISNPDETVGPADVARALALVARQGDAASVDLFRSLRPAPTLRQMFPRRLAAAMATGVVLTGMLLWNTLSEARAACRNLQGQNAGQAWAANRRTADIEKEKKVLQEEAAAVQKFLASRVVWSDYLRDLPTRLPENACLTNITGFHELEATSKKNQRRANRSVMLRGMARFTDRSAAPREIDVLLDSLREVELLKRDFPLVNLAEIKWKKEGASDIAMFTILAMPRDKGGPSPSGKADEKSKE